MNSRRCTSLKTAKLDAYFLKACGKKSCRQCRIRTALIGNIANVYNAFQICTSRNNDLFHIISCTQRGNYSLYHAVLSNYLSNLSLLHIKIFLLLADLFHLLMILYPVSLNSQTVNSRTLSPVEHTALNKAFIGSLTHLTSKSVDLTDKMTLCRSAYRGIAGQICNSVKGNCKKCSLNAKTSRRKSCLNTCVTCTDHRNIIIVYIILFHRNTLPKNYLPTQNCENT